GDHAATGLRRHPPITLRTRWIQTFERPETLTIRNPKQVETALFDCVPQEGKCPHNCNQCFFNREGAFYTPTPSIPTVEEVEGGIVRMNCGHDSNFERDLVIETALKYKDFFFNTSVPRFDFPGPVVLTANPKEEERPWQPAYEDQIPRNLMFVRLRVSSTNLQLVCPRQRARGVDVHVLLRRRAQGARSHREDCRQVLRVAGSPYQLVLVPDQAIPAVRHVPVP